jgi:hypothetical protein
VWPCGQVPVLFLNPANDQAFRRLVDGLIDRGVTDAPELERRLRATYPEAVVRPRDLADEPTSVWYIYREGHWVPPEYREREKGSVEGRG